MRGRGALILLVVAGCTGGFDYTATVSWNATDGADVQSVSVAGQPIVSGESLDRSFDTFAAAAASSQDVEVVTATGTIAFKLVPTYCGGGPAGGETCGESGRPSCDELTRETDKWTLTHRAVASDPLLFYAEGGHCWLRSGQESNWEE